MKTLLAILLFPMLLIAEEENPSERFESSLIHEGKGDRFSLGYGIKWKSTNWDGDIGIKVITWRNVDRDLSMDKAQFEIGISL